MTTPDELVERALEAFALASGLGILPEEGEEADEDYVNGIRAAIALALEEAAKVAEGKAVTAAGDEYQSDKAGHFWDRESIYGTGRSDATAALRAGIAAWPGMFYSPGSQVTRTWFDPGKIILPLPTENTNAEG